MHASQAAASMPSSSAIALFAMRLDHPARFEAALLEELLPALDRRGDLLRALDAEEVELRLRDVGGHDELLGRGASAFEVGEEALDLYDLAVARRELARRMRAVRLPRLL